MTSLESANPDTPASVICASEICPRNPVRTTSDRQMTVPTSVMVIAVRHCELSVSRPSRQSPPAITARTATLAGRGEKGRRPAAIVPLVGSRSPRRKSTSTMRRNGSASLTPGIGPDPACGNQSFVPRNPNHDWVMAIPKAAPVVSQNELKLPSNAAASAATMRSDTVKGSMKLLIDAARMPNAPVSTVDRTQLVPASTSGENPSRTAPFSFSAAARVARPKRVKRKTAQRTAVTTTTMMASIRSSNGITRSPGKCTGSLRMMGSMASACEVKRRVTIACSRMNKPTEATTLARGGAPRRGRKIRKWNNSPSTTDAASEMSMAGQNAIGVPVPICVGQSGRLTPVAPAACRAPSTSASGLGSGGRKIWPCVRRES